MGGREVLELVDEKEPGEPLRPPAERRVGEQALDGADHLLVEVGFAGAAQPFAVAAGDVVEIGDVVELGLDRRPGGRRPSRTRPSASSHGAAGSVSARRGKVDELAEVLADPELLDGADAVGEEAEAEGVERADAEAGRGRSCGRGARRPPGG